MSYNSAFAAEDASPPHGSSAVPTAANFPPPGFPANTVKAVLLKSWSTVNNPSYIFSDLNTNWASYGSTPIFIFDYPGATVTYAGLVATGADVMIISDPLGGGGGIYSPSEIDAINQYASDGHNIIGTYLVFYYFGDNRGLLPTFGLESASPLDALPCSPVYDIIENNSLFNKLTSIYSSSGYSEAQVPTDTNTWGIADLNGARFVAMAPDHRAVITVYDAPPYSAIYISSMPEYFGSTQDKQWFYNAITYQRTMTIGGTLTVENIVSLPWILLVVIVSIPAAIFIGKRSRTITRFIQNR